MADTKKELPDLQNIFDGMRRECYADVKGVEYSSEVPRAAIDFESDKILINPASFAELEGKGMTQEEVVRGYLQHEYFGHKANHPFDVKRLVAEDIALTKAGADGNTKVFVRNRFDDVVGNLKVWNSRKADELRKFYLNVGSNSKYDDVEKSLYQNVLGKDFGAKQLSPELQPYVKKLAGMDLRSGTPVKSVGDCMEQVTEFYDTIKPLLDEMDDKNKQAPFGKNGAGGKKGQGGSEGSKGGGSGSGKKEKGASEGAGEKKNGGGENPGGDGESEGKSGDEKNGNGGLEDGPGDDLTDISSKEVEKAVKELMEDGEIDVGDAKKFLKEYAQGKNEAEKKKALEKGTLGGAPGGVFRDNPDVYANKAIYNVLSERYTLEIKKLPLEQKGGAYPCGYESWNSSDPTHEIDPFTSFGILAPGITKKVERKGMNAFGTCEKTPDLLILLDDSGSMPNPTEEVSNAVLSSFVAAKSYIRNGSEVAPGRFSDRTTVPEFLRDEGRVIDELLKFKHGGDTHVDLSNVEETVEKCRKNKKELDAILISDGKIDNKEEVMEYLSDFNRALMFEIGTSGKPEKRESVTVYHISKEEDLSGIIVGEAL